MQGGGCGSAGRGVGPCGDGLEFAVAGLGFPALGVEGGQVCGGGLLVVAEGGDEPVVLGAGGAVAGGDGDGGLMGGPAMPSVVMVSGGRALPRQQARVVALMAADRGGGVGQDGAG